MFAPSPAHQKTASFPLRHSSVAGFVSDRAAARRGKRRDSRRDGFQLLRCLSTEHRDQSIRLLAPKPFTFAILICGFESSICVVTRQQMGDLDELAPGAQAWNLQDVSVVAHVIVVGDKALLTSAKHRLGSRIKCTKALPSSATPRQAAFRVWFGRPL
jgi:hypothetical protein